MDTPQVIPKPQEMDRGTTQQSVPHEYLLIPLRWAQHIGCKEGAEELSRKYFAMELGFKNYKSQIGEFTDALTCEEENKGGIKKSVWISQPPDVEDDIFFYEVGKKQPNFESDLSKELKTVPAERVLENSINSCCRYKIEIKQLIQMMERLQGPRLQQPLRQMSENVEGDELRQYCLENLESLKGLIRVRDNLEAQLKQMKDGYKLPPITVIETNVEDPEKLKPYGVGHNFSFPNYEWKCIDSADQKKLLRISTEIVQEYSKNFQIARKSINKMQKLRQESSRYPSGNPSFVVAKGLEVHHSHQPSTEERQFQYFFLKWRGLKRIHERVRAILDRYTRDFSMNIEVSEEEKVFGDEKSICKFGEENAVDCPTNWIYRATGEDYKRVNGEIQKECLALQQSVKQMVQVLDNQRKIRTDLQHCHQKWKGLILMNRALLQQDDVISKLEDTLTAKAEEKYVANEQYIFQYAERHSICEDEKHLLVKWPLESITSENELQRTYTELRASCIQLMTQNRTLVENISANRKRIEKRRIKGSNEAEKKLVKEKKELQEELQRWQAGNQKFRNECTKIKEQMDKERIQWGKKDAETIERLAAKDTECDRLQSENIYLIKQGNQKDKEANDKLHELEQDFRRVLSKKQQLIEHLECQNKMAEKSIQMLETEKDALLTRLSKIAGAKLTQGNAAITDLSDKDRPMKIAEKYSELYDNEWTDALEELLDNGATDDEGILILLQIVTETYEFCCKVSQKYQDRIIQSATCLPVVTSVGNIAPPTIQRPTTKNLQESCASLVSDPTVECGQSLTCNQSMKLVKLTEEQKQTLDDLRKDLLPQLLHAAKEQYGGILNALLQRYFGKKEETVTQQGQIKTDKKPKEMEDGSTIETSGLEFSEFHQPGTLDTTNEQGKNKALAKMETASMENSNVHHQHQSCYKEGNRNKGDGNEDNVEILRLHENISSSIKKQADVPYQVHDDSGWTHVHFIHTNQSTDFSDQSIPISKQDVETKANKDVFEEKKKLQDIPFIKTKGFAYMCLNLCWMMRMKDPPLHMVYDIKPGSHMDTDTFKHYTQSGTYVSFLVWPALRLHKDGALLAKGVAQPIKKEEASKE